MVFFSISGNRSHFASESGMATGAGSRFVMWHHQNIKFKMLLQWKVPYRRKAVEDLSGPNENQVISFLLCHPVIKSHSTCTKCAAAGLVVVFVPSAASS